MPNINDKPSYLEKVSYFHIDSFNYVIQRGVNELCLDIDPVYCNASPFVQISISGAKMQQVQYPMGTRKNKHRIVYPSEARIRQTTYFSELKLEFKIEIDVDVFYTQRTFFVPQMIKSQLCCLNGLSSIELIACKEDLNDPGGYFIIHGKERLIRQFVVAKRNYPVALIRKNWENLKKNYTQYGILIRSVRYNHHFSDVSLHMCKNNSIEVCVHYQKKSYFIPILFLLKCLVDKPDVRIFEDIKKFRKGNNHLISFLVVLFRGMLNSEICGENYGELSHNEAKCCLAKLCIPIFPSAGQPNFIEAADYFIKSCVLIHLDDNEKKYEFLCFCICKLFSLTKKEIGPDDPFNPVFQEVLYSGQIYLIALKDGMKSFLNSLRHCVSRKINENCIKLTKDLLQRATNDAVSFTAGLQSMLATGNIPGHKYGLKCSTGYTVPVNRMNFYGIASQLSGLHKLSMLHYTKKDRLFYPESWGFVCPAQTPEGENCGLYNYLASGCEIVSMNSNNIIPNELFKLGMLQLSDSSAYIEDKSVTVYCDGQISGWLLQRNIKKFLNHLKYFRSKSINYIPYHAEIIFVKEDYPQFLFPGIYLFSMPCRLVRMVQNSKTDQLEYLGCFEQLFTQVSIKQNHINPFCESSKDSFLGFSALLIPFGENNPATRNIFSSVKIKQAISFPFCNGKYRSDVQIPFLTSPQEPLVSTQSYSEYNWNENPVGTNVCIAVVSYSGYDMEDAIVLNKAAVERGLMQDINYKTVLYELKALAEELGCKVTELEFRRNPNDPYISDYVDLQGMPYVGALVVNDFPVLSVFCTTTKKWLIKTYNGRSSAHIDSVLWMGGNPTLATTEAGKKVLPLESKKISITYRIKRVPEVGDKFSNRHGQKGICSLIMPSEDLPFTSNGCVPDLLFNPHGLPSRMSVGMMIEILAAKSSALTAIKYVVNPFEFSRKDTAMQRFGAILEEVGFDYYGKEILYSGISGEELECDIFIGSAYYFRLCHVVTEKYQVRSTGDVDPKFQQPRNVNKSGAIRFGEMERDAILSHGAMECTLDRLLLQSDQYRAYVCSLCQTLLYPVLMNENFPMDKSRDDKFCKICKKSEVFEVRIPYPLVFLSSELSALGIKMNFKSEATRMYKRK